MWILDILYINLPTKTVLSILIQLRIQSNIRIAKANTVVYFNTFSQSFVKHVFSILCDSSTRCHTCWSESCQTATVSTRPLSPQPVPTWTWVCDQKNNISKTKCFILNFLSMCNKKSLQLMYRVITHCRANYFEEILTRMFQNFLKVVNKCFLVAGSS